MKALIQEIHFKKEIDGKYGKLYSFTVKYDNQVAIYRSKSKDQKFFKPGEEAEFTEEQNTYTDNQGNLQEYIIIKPIRQERQSNFGKALSKEKARYSAMAVSYSKDLVVAGIIKLDDIIVYARMMFDEMNNMDKSLES